MFQQVTDVFALKRLIGGSPQAGVFQLAFCLLLYNMIHVLAFMSRPRKSGNPTTSRWRSCSTTWSWS